MKGSSKNRGRNRTTTKGKVDSKPRRYDEDRDSEAPGKRTPKYNYPYHKRTDGENDFSWYNRNPSLTVAASSLPFPYRPGMVIPIGEGTSVTQKRIPGIAFMNWAPFVGVGGESTDPVNITAREIFNRVRSSFSGSIDADSPDFVVYLLALDSMFSYIGSLKRIYRIVASYTPMNYAIPDTVLRGIGLSADQAEEVRQNKVLLWQYVNELVAMTRKFVCPAVFPLFNRHYWMNDNVYADENSANAQFYVFNQTFYFKFGLVGDASAGGLIYTPYVVPSTGVVKYMYTFGLQLVQALSNSDDAFIISGYLDRAFRGEPSFVVDELLQDEKFAPIYVPEVLMQIENSYSPFNGSSMSITLQSVEQNPTTNTIKTNFVLATPGTHQGGMINPYLSIRSDQPSVPDVVDASRLQTYVDWSQSKPNLILIAGTELNLGWYMVPLYDSTAGLIQYIQLNYLNVTDSKVADYNTLLVTRDLASAFDWCPFAFDKITNGASTTMNIFGDIHNMTTLSFEQARQINKICLYSEFNAFGINY